MTTPSDGKRAAQISLVAGALGLTLVPLVGAAVAIIAGVLARRSLPPGAEGRRTATFGLVLGVLGAVAPIALVSMASLAPADGGLRSACESALQTPQRFRQCSLLMRDDVQLAAALSALGEVAPASRAGALVEALRSSSLCRRQPTLRLCGGDGGPRDDVLGEALGRALQDEALGAALVRTLGAP